MADTDIDTDAPATTGVETETEVDTITEELTPLFIGIIEDISELASSRTAIHMAMTMITLVSRAERCLSAARCIVRAKTMAYERYLTHS